MRDERKAETSAAAQAAMIGRPQHDEQAPAVSHLRQERLSRSVRSSEPPPDDAFRREADHHEQQAIPPE